MDRNRVTGVEVGRNGQVLNILCRWTRHEYKTMKEAALTENVGEQVLGKRLEFNLVKIGLWMTTRILREDISCGRSVSRSGRGSGLETEMWDIHFHAYTKFLKGPT